MNIDIKTIDSKIFDFVFNIALFDAIHRTNCENYINTIRDSDKFHKAKLIVYKHANNVLFGCGPAVLDTATKVVDVLNDNNITSPIFTFGNAQKLINMTMKYLYISSINSSLRNTFAQCHTPMDSNMRDFVYRSWYYLELNERYGSPGFLISKPWSTLVDERDISQYISFQEAIEKIIEYKDIYIDGIKINHIEFDYMFWNEAKDLKDKTSAEQKAIIQRIWNKYDNGLL